MESSAGSLATFKIDKKDVDLWDKNGPEKFPVIPWESAPRNKDGKDTGSVYVLPRTPEGLVKIGYREIKAGFGYFRDRPFHSEQLCWYTDTLDNSFLIDHVPTYADNSVFVCTGGSGHGAKFMPVLGEASLTQIANNCEADLGR
ncbi:hypothetical protein AC579_6526 [Pseudocercospora musae]|uniref:FAD dependent oxidoreductase domain-containing protein n=1 Tax=Pseudocercospora musae TaxID=113226 RepID=A0A139I121_9PEZI|nr:hypothetical protein AC579_6526 [Pseudocercospora musae]